MQERILINPEKVERFITSEALMRPVGVALRALRRPILNEDRLYSRVRKMPFRGAPAWLTQGIIEQAHVCKFDLSQLVKAPEIYRQISDLNLWLAESRLRLPHETAREQRKWHTRLDHLRTLDDASAMASRDRLQWRGTAAARDRKRRRAVEKDYIVSASLPAELETQGEVVRLCTCPDGRVWMELTSDRALWHEGILMQSKLRLLDIRLGLRQGGWRIFSLRSEGAQSQLTAEVHASGVWIASRRADEPMAVDDIDAIADLLKSVGREENWRRNFLLMQEERCFRQEPEKHSRWIAVMDALKAA